MLHKLSLSLLLACYYVDFFIRYSTNHLPYSFNVREDHAGASGDGLFKVVGGWLEKRRREWDGGVDGLIS